MKQMLLILLMTIILCAGAHAEQFLVLDKHFTHTAEGDDSKYMGFSILSLLEEVPVEEVPSNWTTPVNYAGGTAYFRLTVYSKPTEKAIYYQFCFTRDMGYGYAELCSSYEPIKTTGVHEWHEPLSSWWEPEDERLHVDFNRPPYRLLIACWGWIDGQYKVLDDRWGYGSYLTPELIADFYPMEVRFQVVLVSEGGTFEGFPGDVVTVDESEPSPLTVSPAFPNPFNATTTIRYALPEDSAVEVSVYDMLGRKITSLVNETQSSGVHGALWNGTDGDGMAVGNGVYFYRVTAGGHVAHGRMMLMK